MKSRKKLVFWCSLLGVILVLTLFSDLLATQPVNEMDLDSVYAPPGDGHLLGTDHLGRDVFSRLLQGGKVTLTVAGLSVALSFAIGVIYGGISGYVGGWADSVMMRVLEAFISIPSLIFVLAFQAIMQGGMWEMTFIIGVTGWFTTARIVRSEFIRLKDAEYVKMAKMFGTPVWRIITGHLLRNSLAPLFVVTIYQFGRGGIHRSFPQFPWDRHSARDSFLGEFAVQCPKRYIDRRLVDRCVPWIADLHDDPFY